MKNKQYILAGNFIDGSGGKLQRKVLLKIVKSRITAIGSLSDFNGVDRKEVEDFSHCTILPPLFDCSISLSRSPSITSDPGSAIEHTALSSNPELPEKHIGFCFSHGVLGAADNTVTNSLSQAMMTQYPGIKIKTSSKFSQMGHNHLDGDFIRIQYSKNMEGNEDAIISKEKLAHIIQNSSNQKTIVVANGSQQVQEALEAGCDAIEQGYNMGKQNLQKLSELGTLWIPSVLRAKTELDGSTGGGDVCCRFSQRYVAPGKPLPGAEEYWKKMLSEQIQQLKEAKQLGLKTAIGTGAGNIAILHGESMVEEMKLFMKAGYSLSETIHCASDAGARFFDIKELGSLGIGKIATFLITRGTPQQLPRKLSYLEGIYINGKQSSLYRKNPVKAV